MDQKLTSEERKQFNALFLSELLRQPINAAFVAAVKVALEVVSEDK